MTSGKANPHLAAMAPADDVADLCPGETLFLVVAAEGFVIEAYGMVESKPQMAFAILGNTPTFVGPLRRRRLLIALDVKRNLIVEFRAVVISQGTDTTAPYSAPIVFVEGLHGPSGNAIGFQIVERGSIVPADAIPRSEPQPALTVFVHGMDPVTTQTVLCGKRQELLPVIAGGAIVTQCKPEITRAVVGDMPDVHSWKAVVNGIGPPGAGSVKWLDHGRGA